MISIKTLIRHAANAGHHQHHHVAILTKGGSVIAIGVNRGTRHAEDSVLRKVWPNRRRGLVLWSFRLTKTGKLAQAKPCSKCQKMLLCNGITKVVYSDSKGLIQTMRLKGIVYEN